MRNHIIQSTLKLSKGIACLKQPVYAKLVTANGEVFFGSNEMQTEGVTECPRVALNLPSGEGYHHCQETCGQHLHAEREAIHRAKNSGFDTVGAIIYLVGHHYCCDNCMNAMREAGVLKVVYVEYDFKEEIL